MKINQNTANLQSMVIPKVNQHSHDISATTKTQVTNYPD